MSGRRGFTLIELLIVVAIIAILAAIAVPNFLEAQMRGKVAASLAALRTTATALELYRVDQNTYPPHGEVLASGVVNVPAVAGGLTTVEFLPGRSLTTPVAYLTTVADDPLLGGTAAPATRSTLAYVQSNQMATIMRGRGLAAAAESLEPRYGAWRLAAAGPDGDRGSDLKINLPYDATNGTVSDGDLIRTQREPAALGGGDE